MNSSYTSSTHKIRALFDEVIEKQVTKMTHEQAIALISEFLDNLPQKNALIYPEKVYSFRWLIESDKDKLVHTRIYDQSGKIINLKRYVNGQYLINILPIGVNIDFSWWVDADGYFCFYSADAVISPISIYIFIYNIQA